VTSDVLLTARLNPLGLGSFFQRVVTGLVLIVALVLDHVLEQRRRA
jgi:ribose/xylose/arabinose/galactoside ABC-type transport system permease subunit